MSYEAQNVMYNLFPWTASLDGVTYHCIPPAYMPTDVDLLFSPAELFIEYYYCERI